MKRTTVYLSAGCNMGNKEANLREGVRQVGDLTGTELRGVSALYCSAPVGYLDQDDFLNIAVQIETELEPLALLHELQKIEHQLGRVRIIHWGPRTLDLDIVLFGTNPIDLPELQVPHPRCLERAFVLVPLQEIAPGLIINGESIQSWLSKIHGQKIFLFKQNWFGKL